MRNYLIIFFISLVFGFGVLFFRINYENKTGESKSHWNLTELQEGDSKNFYDRGLAISHGSHYFAGCEEAPIVAFFRPPVYPVFLALSFLVFGISFKAVIILQLIIASLAVILISAISGMVFDSTVSRISAALAILYYPMWNDAMIINSELLSMFLGLVALYFIIKLFISRSITIKYLFLSGLFVGLSSLTRGQFFFYSVLFVIFIFSAVEKEIWAKIKYSFIWLLFGLIPILFWSVYAYLSAGVVIFISSQGALSVWWGWSPLVVLEQHYPVWNDLWDKSFIRDDMIGAYLPVKSSLWFLSEAFNFIFKYPVESLKIAYFKLLDSWGFMDIYSGNSAVSKFIKILKLNWDLFLAVPGFIILWKQKEKRVFAVYVLSACIMFSMVSIMTAGLVRYRIPFLDPLLIILASLAVFNFYTSLKNKKSKV
jgi:4-amino-4-deoxy-L-arabinose transferase-like glycosyltransferase